MKNDTVKLLTRKEAAQYLGLSVRTLETWARQADYNELPIIKMGTIKGIRYKISDLDEYIEKKRKTNNE